MLRKVVITGPESTGKSTLSKLLAEYYHTSWTPEYAREYINKLHRAYNEEDLSTIANGQLKAEARALEQAKNGLLFCDTDLYVIKVWSEHSYQNCNKQILTHIAKNKYDLYLLSNIDLPWQPDPQREHPQPKMRQYFYNIYRDIVINSGVPWADISGSYEERFKRAINAVKQLIANS